jgi:hypothetical protein
MYIPMYVPTLYIVNQKVFLDSGQERKSYARPYGFKNLYHSKKTRDYDSTADKIYRFSPKLCMRVPSLAFPCTQCSRNCLWFSWTSKAGMFKADPNPPGKLNSDQDLGRIESGFEKLARTIYTSIFLPSFTLSGVALQFLIRLFYLEILNVNDSIKMFFMVLNL